MLQYGIFAPAQGLREDFPSIFLADAYLPEDDANADIEIHHGEIRRAKKRNEILDTVPDGNPILHYHLLETTTGTKKLFTFTKDTIYRWLPSGIGVPTFTGGGLDDMDTLGGTYTGAEIGMTYKVVIDASVPSPDTFEWYKKSAGGAYGAAQATGVNCSLTDVTLDNGVKVKFAAVDGHTVTDYWEFTVGKDFGQWEDVSNCKFGATDATYWSSCTFDDQMICCNGNTDQKVLTCGATGDCTILDDTTEGIVYAAATYLTAAKFVIEYERYLFVLGTYEDGAWYPSRLRWCELGDETTWDSGDAGSLDLAGADAISGAGKHGSYLIVLKENSHHEVWLTTDTLIFAAADRSWTVGCKSTGSVVNGKQGELYWLDQHKTIRELQWGEKSRPVDKTLKKIPDDLLSLVKGMLTDNQGEIIWALPKGADATANNHAAVLKPGIEGAANIWTPRTYDITAFGRFQWQYDYTWDTIPYATWDDWAAESWDSIQMNSGYLMDICGDANGKTYSLHDSGRDQETDFTGAFVLATDLTGGRQLSVFKRILRIQLILRGQGGGSFNLAAKRDYEGGWRTWGGSTSLSLTSNKEFQFINIPCDLRGRTFLFKGYAANPFSFCGMIFDFVGAGER